MQLNGRIFIYGDITIDWNLARIRRSKEVFQSWGFDDCTRATSHPGGAALLGNLVAAIANDLKENKIADTEVVQQKISDSPIEPVDARYQHSYAMWSLLDDMKAWRVEEFLGLDRCTDIEIDNNKVTPFPEGGFT